MSALLRIRWCRARCAASQDLFQILVALDDHRLDEQDDALPRTSLQASIPDRELRRRKTIGLGEAVLTSLSVHIELHVEPHLAVARDERRHLELVQRDVEVG